MANYKLKELIVPGSSNVYDIDAKYIEGTSPSTYVHNNMKEAYLTWGGTNLAGNITPIDMATSNIHSANRLAFAKPAGITIEYLRSGGSWTDYGASDTTKISLVSGLGAVLSIGNRTSGTAVGDKLRLTLTASKMGVYTRMEKILLNISTNYATGSNVVVEKSLIGSETTFSTVGTYALSGWSGWNSIPYSTAFGGSSSQTSQTASLRFTFGITGVNADTSKNSALQLLDIAIFGSTYWNYPSNLAKTGHLYSYDSSQNATFPANVTATKFKGNLEGNADTATKVLTTQATSQNIQYDLLAAPINSDTYKSLYKDYNVKIIPAASGWYTDDGSKYFDGGTKLLIGDVAASDAYGEYDNGWWEGDEYIESWETYWEPEMHAGTGHLEVTGNLIVGSGSDNYGIFPARHNYSTIGDPNHYWYRIYANQIFQSGSQVLNTIKEDGITGSNNNGMATINRFGTCSTAAGTATKTVSITSGTFSLASGLRVTVKFNNKNTASNPTLNVNSKGAKNIYHKGARITTGTNKSLLAGVCDFVYDGTQWHLVGNYVDTTHSGIAYCTSAASTTTKIGDMPGFALVQDQYILLRTTVTNSATSSVTLNVNNTGAKPIKIGTADVTASNFPAGDYFATYDGTNWVLTRIYLTDTKNTAGSTDTSSKIYLIGATSQAANPQTYSHDTAYVGTDGCLYSGGSKVLTAHPTITKSNDTTSTATLSHSGTFTAIDSVTRDSNGHVTTINTKTYTLPASGNTDYKASSYNTSSKIFLIGATSQGSSTSTGMTTYSHDTAYVGTDGCLYSNSTKVSVDGHTHSYLPLSGGTMTGVGQITNSNTGGMWVEARAKALIRHDTYTSGSSYSPILSCKTSVGEISQGIIHPEDRMVWTYTKDTDFNAGNNSSSQLMYLNTAGDLTVLKSVSAPSFTATSDKRLKENIESYVCDKSILELDVKKFDFINGEKNQIGCLAQDLQEICPEMVVEDKNGYLGIKESKLVYLLLQELKNQKEEIAYLKKELSNLK